MFDEKSSLLIIGDSLFVFPHFFMSAGNPNRMSSAVDHDDTELLDKISDPKRREQLRKQREQAAGDNDAIAAVDAQIREEIGENADVEEQEQTMKS